MRRHVILPVAFAAIGLLALATFEWGTGETLRVAVGATALWGPFALLLSLWLVPAVPDVGERFTLSLVVSYATAALLFFLLSVAGVGWLFPWLQVASVAGVVAYKPWRERIQGGLKNWRVWRFDWWLAALIVATLIVSVRHRVAFDISPTDGTRHFRLYHDQTYHTAMTYELERHVPPLQRATAAGGPERAYHLLPHVSTLLLARYGDQPDLLRVQTTWSFIAMTVILCLCLHFMVRRITGSRRAGWLAVTLLFILSIPFPPLIPNPLGYFYFSIYPHTTSLLEPVVMTTQQMYSGMVVFYGIALGATILDRGLTSGQRAELWRVVLLVGIMTGAMLRFRAHAFLPLAPAFGLAGLWLAWRTRDWRMIVGVAAAVGISLVLLAEMRRPAYLAGTTSVALGYNAITWPGTMDHPNPLFVWWWMFWPEAKTIQALVAERLPEAVAKQVWHVVCVGCFTLFQVVGLPLAATAGIFIARSSAWRHWALFTGLAAWMTLVSMLGAMYLNMGSQSYDLAGQMLLHICWYLFPTLPVVLWGALHRVKLGIGWPARRWSALAIGVVALAIPLQLLRGPSSLEMLCSNMGFTLSEAEWEAFAFLRNETPRDAVVLMPIRPLMQLHPNDPNAEGRLLGELRDFAICGALGGRAAYIEYAHGKDDLDRVRNVFEAWQTPDAADFANRIRATNATHMLEYAITSPRAFNQAVPAFLELVWESRPGRDQVRIWHIDREKAGLWGNKSSPSAPPPAEPGKD